MLSPAALLVSAVATAALSAGPSTVDTALSLPATPTLTAPTSSHCPKHGHHKRCHQTRDSAVEQLSDGEVAVVGAALVALALAAL
jgi:hypothetical protein